MRGLVPKLETPHPLGSFLPAIYQQDSFARRLTSAFDEALSPIFSTLDNFDAYLDPLLAPEDFLDWLAGWVGLVLDETWPIERRRAFVAKAVELYRMRGTAVGLISHIEIFTGGSVELLESGAAAWSSSAGGQLPGTPGFTLLVRVRVAEPEKIQLDRLDALVAAAKPAHMVHRVELVGAARPPVHGGEE